MSLATESRGPHVQKRSWILLSIGSRVPPGTGKEFLMLDKRPLGVYGALLRDATPLQSSVSLVNTLMLLPKGAIYFGTRKHNSVVKVLSVRYHTI